MISGAQHPSNYHYLKQNTIEVYFLGSSQLYLALHFIYIIYIIFKRIIPIEVKLLGIKRVAARKFDAREMMMQT
jgi:hypothetical protein